MRLKTIEEFKGGFRELARSNRYMLLPSLATPPLPELCISAQIHGENLSTLTYTNGLDTARWKQPYESNYPDLSLTFLDNQEMLNRRFYEHWMGRIVTPIGINYHNDYAVDEFQIAQMGRDGVAKKKFHFYEVYPLSITAISYDSSGQNAFTTFTVSFDHHYRDRIKDADYALKAGWEAENERDSWISDKEIEERKSRL